MKNGDKQICWLGQDGGGFQECVVVDYNKHLYHVGIEITNPDGTKRKASVHQQYLRDIGDPDWQKHLQR